MRSIENGLSMKTDPIEVYEHLFSKGNPDAPLVAVGPAADAEIDVSQTFNSMTFA